ncbi:MAG TPA: tetratricopeptide repeat protein [Ignavibacteriales bacterium]|nr:tetratricopeptide repeat protein [Ignavibacteriales bacterium]
MLLVFSGIFFSGSLFAQQYPDPKVDYLLRSGINKIMSRDYDEAETVFRKLDESYPDLPLGNIYLAANKIALAADNGEAFDEKYIDSKFDEAEKQIDKLLSKNENNPWHQYFAALQKGYYAYYKALNKDYISAFSNGLSSVSKFEKCLKLDSSFYEAYIAIGSYKYWKSAKTEFLRWLPFVSDEKELGIKYLKMALSKKTYNYVLAENSLMWIYLNQKEYQKAVSLSESVLREYPENRSFKWGLGQALQRTNKARAIEVFTGLLKSFTDQKNNNHYNEIILKNRLAVLYHETGNDKKALQMCNEILSTTQLSEYVKDRLDDRMDRVKKFKEELMQQ